MSKDSRTDSINEMEQIQRGLEAFLEKELTEMQMQQEEAQPYQLQEGEKKERPEKKKEQPEEKWELHYQEEEIGEGTAEDIEIEGEAEVKGETEEKLDNREDWDSPEHRRKMKEQKKRSAGSRGKVKRKRKSRCRRLLMILVMLVVLAAGGLYLAVGSVYNQMHYEAVDSVTASPMEKDGVTNVLLIGNDSRQNGEDGRSDAMILISISSKTKKIYMTSLLRDMYVEIPGYKNNRLNAAYSFGGAELLMETVEKNLAIPVNRYVLVNFEAFANLVDAVGGVDLELTSEEITYVNGYLVEYNILTNRPEGTDYMDPSVSGMVHLNGPQALAYSRNRYLGTDFGRTERQRKVLADIIKKLPKALITNPRELIGGLMTNLTTNVTQGECYWLSLKAAAMLGYDIVQGSIPLEGTYQNATIREMQVLEVDFEANKQYIRENIYGEGLQE